MKRGQLVEYNMRNIFLEKLCPKLGGEVSPIPFNKNSKLSISVDQQSEVLWKVCFCCISKTRYFKILKLRCWQLAFTLYEALLKKKNRSGTSLLTHFLHDFWRNIFLTLYFINWPHFIVWLPLPFVSLGNMCIVFIFCPVCHLINFETNRSFLFKLFFYITKKPVKKCKYFDKKRVCNIQKVFFSYLKDFQLSEIVSDSRVGL